jgi:sarcosine oxidase
VHTTATLEHVGYVRPRDAHTVTPPVFVDHGEPVVYGLPTPASDRYKIAVHHGGATVDPDGADFAHDAGAVAALRRAAIAWLPEYDPGVVDVDVCLYDNTPDEDFVLDRAGHVVVGAGTSGHGFKFGILLGELLASLVQDTEPAVDLTRFRRDRLR